MPPDGEGAAVGALNMEKENMSKWKQMYKCFLAGVQEVAVAERCQV